jgi:hypothetical protein
VPFYAGVLGLGFISAGGFALVFNANGITIRVLKRQQFRPVPYTVLGLAGEGNRKGGRACGNKGCTSSAADSSSRTNWESGVRRAGQSGLVERPGRQQVAGLRIRTLEKVSPANLSF